MDNLHYAEQIEELKDENAELREQVRDYAVKNVALAKRLMLRDKQRLSYRKLVRRYHKKFGDIDNG